MFENAVVKIKKGHRGRGEGASAGNEKAASSISQVRNGCLGKDVNAWTCHRSVYTHTYT